MKQAEWLNYTKPLTILTENQLLTITMYGEARGEDWEGLVGVLNVIRNRTYKSRFKDSNLLKYTDYHAVILKQWQFSCFLKFDPNSETLFDFARGFHHALLGNSFLNDIYTVCKIKNFIMDTTSGADHYFSKYITAPEWSKQMTKTCEIGNHIFFKD